MFCLRRSLSGILWSNHSLVIFTCNSKKCYNFRLKNGRLWEREYRRPTLRASRSCIRSRTLLGHNCDTSRASSSRISAVNMTNDSARMVLKKVHSSTRLKDVTNKTLYGRTSGLTHERPCEGKNFVCLKNGLSIFF